MASKIADGCVVGPKARVSGTLSGGQDLLVQGIVEGQINLSAQLVVGPSGSLQAKLRVDRAEVAGEVNGDIDAREHLVIRAGARVQGRISAPSLVIAPGAWVCGDVVMKVQLPEQMELLVG